MPTDHAASRLLDDKVCVITGAARGIGAGIAHAFAGHGARVVVADTQDTTEVTGPIEREHGQDSVVSIPVDVRSADAVDAMFAQISERFGRVDVLVNNAAVAELDAIESVSPDTWDRTLEINLRGYYLCTRRAVPLMRTAGGGTIINMTSGVVILALANMAPYCASKSGIVGLTKSLAVELARDQITVNAIAPGAIDTPINASAYTERVRHVYSERIPLGRLGTPADVAGTAVFLASSLAGYVNGHTLVVDGGLNVNGTVGHGEE